MQCEFSKAELIKLDLGIIERRDRLQQLQNSPPDKTLAESIKQLETLHDKLNGLIEQVEKEVSPE